MSETQYRCTHNNTMLLLLCVQPLFLCMQDGQLVTFAEVSGMPTLNDKKPRRIKNVKVQFLCTQQASEQSGLIRLLQSEREAVVCSAVLLCVFITLHDAIMFMYYTARIQRGCQGQTAL